MKQWTPACVLSFVTACLVALNCGSVSSLAEAPDFTVKDGALHIEGVGPNSPIIYDNDWWTDVFDDYYLWAQASLDDADLRGNVVTRDMWDHPDYQYAFEDCMEDAREAIELARRSNLGPLPDPTPGAKLALERPESGKIEDTEAHPTPGSQLIIEEAGKASPERPLVIIAGGPLTTVANALLQAPEIGDRMVVFCLSAGYYQYNGKDGWSGYVTAKRARFVEWATGEFWEKNEVFAPGDFDRLPSNPVTEAMREFLETDLGQANQLGDGAPLVWLYDHSCWEGAIYRRAVYEGPATEFPETSAEEADLISIPRRHSDFSRMRSEFFRVMTNPKAYSK